MPEQSPAIEAILAYVKTELKRRDLTYQDVAAHLGVSAASVKRHLNSGQLSLADLERLAQLLGDTLPNLLAAASQPAQALLRFSEEQEEALAARPELLTYFLQLTRGRSPGAIEAAAGISHVSTRRYLRALEELGLVEVLPGDKVRVPPSHKILFRPGGAINARLFPARLARGLRRIEERGQPNVFAHPTAQGWLGRYQTIFMDDSQYAALLTELEEVLARHDAASATARGAERGPVTIVAFVDRFDLYEGVLPPIGEI